MNSILTFFSVKRGVVFGVTPPFIFAAKVVSYYNKVCVPFKHTTSIPRLNDVETVVSTLFQHGIHVVYL